MSCTNDIDVAIRYFVGLSKITQFNRLFKKDYNKYDREYVEDHWKSFDSHWISLDKINRVRYLNLARAYNGISNLS
jgi:hypothetical protein